MELEQKEKAQKAKEEEEKRIASLSPVDKSLEELIQKNLSNMPLHTLIIKEVKENKVAKEHIKEFLLKAKNYMQDNGKYKENSNSKKPEKDKDYHKTLELLELIKQYG